MRYIFVLLAVLLTGCVSVSQSVDPKIAAEIPDGADAIRVYHNASPDSQYATLYRALAGQGYTIASSNNEMRTLATAPKSVGQETTLAISLFVEDGAPGSVATLRGFWGITGSFATGLSAGVGAGIDKDFGEPAEWQQTHRAGVAFGALAELANSLPHSSVEYVDEQ